MRKARWIALALLLFFPAELRAAPPAKSGAATAAAAGKKKKKKPKKPETPAQEAKRHRDAGAKAHKARKYETAVPELEAAYKLEPQPGVLLMLGDSYFQLKDFLASYEAYDRVLTDHANDVRPAQKAEADKAIRQLEALTSQLEVMVDEKDAVIYVDGKSVGKSPMKSPVRVSAAKHRVRVTAGSFEPIEQEVEPKPGERLVVPIRFVPDGSSGEGTGTGPAKLKVTATPAEATIELDGKEVGTGGYEGEVIAGKHRLVVRAQGFESFVQELEVKAGESATRDVQLEKEGGDGEKAAPAPSKSTRGLYLNLAAFGGLPLSGHVKQPCPDGGSCTSSQEIGGGGVLRFGYRFGLVGLELVGSALYARHAEKMNIPGTDVLTDPAYAAGDIARIENYNFSSFGGMIGLGPRLTTAGDVVNLSVGVAGGLALRNFSVRREVGGAIQDSYRTSVTNFGPGLATDVSMLIGSTPGLKFVVGVFGWVNFGGTVSTRSGDPRVIPVDFQGVQVDATLPTPSYTVARGVQFFVGPQLGIQLGH